MPTSKNVSVNDVFDMYSLVSDMAKKYETTTGEPIPVEVNNEFRYSFRSFIDYFDNVRNNENNENNYHIVRAHYALMCAYFDLIDGIVISNRLYLDTLLDRYPKETIKILTNIEDINKYTSQIEDKIINSRGNNQDIKLDIYQNICEHNFKKLLEHYLDLKNASSKIYNSRSKIGIFFSKYLCWCKNEE